MQINGASSPWSFTLKSVDDLPTFIFQTFCQSNKNRVFLQFFAHVTDLIHDFSAVTGAAHEDDSSITPIILNFKKIYCFEIGIRELYNGKGILIELLSALIYYVLDWLCF